MCCMLAVLVIGMLALPFLADHAVANIAALPLAGFAIGETVTRSLKEMRADSAKLYKELAEGEKEISEKGVDQTRGDELDAKATELIALQKEIDRAERIANLAAKGREIEDPALPANRETKEQRGRGAGLGADGSPIVGHMTVGNMFVNSKSYREFIQRGAPKGQFSDPMEVKGLHEPLIAITEKMVESKAVATVGADVIQPDRVSDVVRVTEQDRLRLRDVLQVSQTTSNAVEYVVIQSVTRAAEPVAEAAAKPEATLEVTTATAPVRTLAVHMPITEQQLSDIPALRSMIDNELLYDLAKLEEEQVMWGSGAGQNLQGILTLAGVPAVTRTAPAATQNIDRVKIAATDVMVAGYDPNALVIHPIDWEQIVLLKGTDDRYIWALVELNNRPRIWSMGVVETVAMKKPAATTRNFLVGDFIRGATLWDRERASVQVGWIDDQFILNMRTIRAEERLAFGIKRPLAFEKYETAA